MNFSEHVTDYHLARKAIIYIRQSTPHQVKNNLESQQLQLALKERAIQYGWPVQSIEVLDSDLGFTGATIEDREGIQYLIEKINRGEVGIIFCYEVSRLMRNCTDWYLLLDRCSRKQTLIGDKDGIYDPKTGNGRLILGFKGQIAEFELSTLKGRMHEGLINKAKRGDLITLLPTGLICPHKGYVTLDPNIEVQNCISNIFEVFLKVKSASKVLKFFNQNNLKIARYTNKNLTWKKPTISAILSILKNPAYAGASVYGRTETFIDDKDNKPKKKSKLVSMNKWKYVIKDKFPAYITWETFELIQNMLKENYAEYCKNQSRGIPRQGKSLLHGIIYCGCCASKMFVQYQTCGRYICNALKQRRGTPTCQSFRSDPIDKYVVEMFFQALSPIELDAYEKTIEDEFYKSSMVNKMKAQQIERLRYQAKLAERQYYQVDPDNRLIAVELERRWETALRELKEAELEQKEELLKNERKFSELPPDLRRAFLSLGKELPTIWEQISHEHKKSFLRCLIDKVVVHRKEQKILEVRIVWTGGATTTKDMVFPSRRLSLFSKLGELEESIIELAKLGYDDKLIAEKLTEKGFRSTKSEKLLISTVQTIRINNGITRRKTPNKIQHISGCITVTQLAKRLNISKYWVYHQIEKGTVEAMKDVKTGYYLFPDNPMTDEKFMTLKNNKNLKVHG